MDAKWFSDLNGIWNAILSMCESVCVNNVEYNEFLYNF